jgi:hypothetical protein
MGLVLEWCNYFIIIISVENYSEKKWWINDEVRFSI